MDRQKGFYAIIQFSPVPERFEFINVGVFLAVPSAEYIGVKFGKTNKRIEKLFGHQNKSYLESLKASLDDRLRFEFKRSPSMEGFVLFARNRANEIRFSQILPISVGDAESDLMGLFDKLVGDDEVHPRGQRMATKLKTAFENAGVLRFVDEPEPVVLPQGVTISAPFAYQNGAAMARPSPLPMTDPERAALMDVCHVALMNRGDLKFARQRLSFEEFQKIKTALVDTMLIWLDERGSNTQ